MNKRDVPRGNYDYVVQPTGYRVESHVFAQLVVRVQDHMDSNGIPIPPNLETEIEQDYCNRNPDNCKDTDPSPSGDDLLTSVAAALAVPAADALAKLSSAFGIHCKSCNYRHRIIRRMRKLGLQETIRQLKGTF